MKNKIITLVPCQLEFRDTVGAQVRQICTRLEKDGEPKGFADQVVSAFNEAFNNCVAHSYSEPDETTILIFIEVTDSQLIIEFDDDGKSFDLEKDAPTVGELCESGMGLFIMRSFMSKLEYTSKNKKTANVLRMVRDLTDAQVD